MPKGKPNKRCTPEFRQLVAERRQTGETAAFIQQRIPRQLGNEYWIYNSLIACVRILHGVVEQCIRDGLLPAPERRLCAEGILLMVEKESEGSAA